MEKLTRQQLEEVARQLEAAAQKKSGPEKARLARIAAQCREALAKPGEEFLVRLS